MKLPILALGHQSRVGKDTAARAICAAIRGAERVAFAGHLKGLAAQLFGRYGLKGGAFYETPAGAALRDVPLPGIGGSLRGKTPVELWVELGQALRGIHADVWVDHALNETRLNPVRLLVVSDLRFPNEFIAVKRLGGWCVRVVRPDAPEPKGSDRFLDHTCEWDRVLPNTGDVASLERAAVQLAWHYLEQRA